MSLSSTLEEHVCLSSASCGHVNTVLFVAARFVKVCLCSGSHLKGPSLSESKRQTPSSRTGHSTSTGTQAVRLTSTKGHSSLAGHSSHKQGTAQEQGTKDTQHRHTAYTHTHSRHTQHTQTQLTTKTRQSAVGFASAAMPGVWIGGLPWWASQQEVLNWRWTFGSNPEGIQLIARRDDTLISCIAHYGSEAGQQAALRALGHSFYGFRVSVRPQRIPGAKAPGTAKQVGAPAQAPAPAPAPVAPAAVAPAAVAPAAWRAKPEVKLEASWKAVQSWRLVLLAMQSWKLAIRPSWRPS